MNKALTGSLIGIVLIGGGLAGGSYYMGSPRRQLPQQL